MPCFSPLMRGGDGKGKFAVWSMNNATEALASKRFNQNMSVIPCRNCIGCRQRKRLDWTLRGVHELQTSGKAAFITLTYDDDHLPADKCISIEVLQKFFKRLRKQLGSAVKIRYYACGEYGEQSDRPHYHAIIYGWDFPDREVVGISKAGHQYFSSPLLSKVWKFGYNVVAEVNLSTIAYVAKYTMKKITGDAADEHYSRIDETTGEVYRLTPEFQLASRNPAIGRTFFEKYEADIFPADEVVHEGRAYPVPEYYNKLLGLTNPEVEEQVKFQRNWNRVFKHTYKNLDELSRVEEAKLVAIEKRLFEREHVL